MRDRNASVRGIKWVIALGALLMTGGLVVLSIHGSMQSQANRAQIVENTNQIEKNTELIHEVGELIRHNGVIAIEAMELLRRLSECEAPKKRGGTP